MSTIDPAREFTLTANERKKYVMSTKHHRFPSAEAERDWARTQFKPCTKCHASLPLSYFNGNTSGADPFDKTGLRLRRPECRACTTKVSGGKAAAAQAAKRLGMPTKAPAGTRCELCSSDVSLVFDHDHTTDRFRGWLCNSCNRSIGVLGDNVAELVKAINYLNRAEKRTLRVNPTTGELVVE
jgi:hypothetical protein